MITKIKKKAILTQKPIKFIEMVSLNVKMEKRNDET